VGFLSFLMDDQADAAGVMLVFGVVQTLTLRRKAVHKRGAVVALLLDSPRGTLHLARLLRKSSYRVTFFDGESIECLQIYGRTMRSLYVERVSQTTSVPTFNRLRTHHPPQPPNGTGNPWEKFSTGFPQVLDQSDLVSTKLRSLHPEDLGKFSIFLL
jgi:hypothetical protein